MKNRMENLKDLFKQQIIDLYHAENQVLEFLSKLENAVHNEYLALAIREQREGTQRQIKRLESIENIMDLNFERGKCHAASGLITECSNMMNANATNEVKDAGIIAQTQKIVHFEISCYGTAKHYANRLGLGEAEKLLSESLSEEQDVDTNLNRLARRDINQKALAS